MSGPKWDVTFSSLRSGAVVVRSPMPVEPNRTGIPTLDRCALARCRRTISRSREGFVAGVDQQPHSADLRRRVVRGAARADCSAQPQPLTSGEAFASVAEHAYCYNLEATKREMAAAYLALLGNVPVMRLSRSVGFEGFEDFLDVAEGLMTAASP